MYELIENNDTFLIIDKAPGIGFHRTGTQTGLLEMLRSDLRINELYPVHRLDKMTSGLLLFAKKRATARELAGQFQSKSVEKYYIALSDKKPKKKQGLVIGDMGRTRRGMWKLLPGKTNPAITRFYSRSIGPHLRLFMLRLYTGRTHQARVILKSIGAPILGDLLYYKESAARRGVDRGYLHSYAMVFTLEGESFRFVRIPDKGIHFNDESLRTALKDYGSPWELPWPDVKFKIGSVDE
jgi:tRNA pseudouridine32 synthase/23S rRNA pseudouridine746 synthase